MKSRKASFATVLKMVVKLYYSHSKWIELLEHCVRIMKADKAVGK